MGINPVHLNASAVSDIGCRRSSNEDSCSLSIERGVFVVCDGMGGAAAGEVASSMAVDELMRQFENLPAAAPLPQAAEEAVLAANRAVYERAGQDPSQRGMGTTLVALVARESRAWMLNVGDSRGYRMRGRRLEQITQDHSLVEEYVRSGRMSREEAERAPFRNVITRALGTQNSVAVDVFPLDVEPGDRFLLCSDGLTRELSDDLLESMLALGLPLHELCQRLVNAANQAGGHDNITCLLVQAEP